MAKSQIKAGGPTRGRRRVRKIGMGSGAHVARVRDQRKGAGKSSGGEGTGDASAAKGAAPKS